MNLLYEKRREFFAQVAAETGSANGAKQIVLTHFLPDRPELLEAFDKIAPIALLIAIPYSIDQNVLKVLSAKYTVVTPSLRELYDETYITGLLQKTLAKDPAAKFGVMEIGGYFAPWLKQIKSHFGDQITGFVEDTQNGHTRYEAAEPLPYPVISVAKSTLKEGEDTLVGPSCYFSTDRLMRSLGVVLAPRVAMVIGYGKVGRGMAHILKDNYCTTSVYDINPIRNCVAQGDGMLIPARNAALSNCGIIFGCTGTTSVGSGDFEELWDGCFLVSCSSKDIEFDLKALNASHTREVLADNVERYVSRTSGKHLFLLGKGTPINFLDGAVFGPPLTLVQAELVVAAKQIHEERLSGKLTEVADLKRRSIASRWQAEFINSHNGQYSI